MRAHLFVESLPAQLFRGAGYPLRGLSLLMRDRKMILLSLVPFLISLLLYLVVLVLVASFGGRIMDLVIESGAWWRTIIRAILMVAMVCVFLLVFVFTYSILSLVIAAPFFELISAAAERAWTGQVREEPTGFKEILVDIWRSITEAVKFLLIEIVLWILAIAGAPVSTVPCVALSAVVIGLEHMEGPMGRRRMTFRSKVGFARRHFWLLLGFGTVATVVLLIPVVGAACMPAGVVGGTLMFCDIESETEPDSATPADR